LPILYGCFSCGIGQQNALGYADANGGRELHAHRQ
jgi:hypothetical protein